MERNREKGGSFVKNTVTVNRIMCKKQENLIKRVKRSSDKPYLTPVYKQFLSLQTGLGQRFIWTTF